ncbi:EamA family transporter [Desulfurobacterium indicum]|uniref:EamA family transporter n=1 Tax=Desulfurobacterium indicum TaxID=1914305 RepID=UPI001C1F2398
MHHKAVTVTAWQILISIFITVPFLFLTDWCFTVNGFLVTLFAGIIHTALALFLWYDALNYIKVSFASILQYFDIVFAIILAYLFLSQVPTARQVLGAFFNYSCRKFDFDERSKIWKLTLLVFH